jgi:subtilisin family serine protease
MASILAAILKCSSAVFMHGNLCWQGGRISWKGFRVLLISSVLFFCGMNGRATGMAPVAGEFRPDQILVQPRKNISAQSLAAFHAAQHSEIVKSFPKFGGVQVLRVPPNETVASLIAKYQASGLVEFAEPDYIVHACAAPDDPFFQDGSLWWLNNTGQNGGTPGADIKAQPAWDVLNDAGKIVVAILDSGIRATHEDLAGNMWVNPVDGGHGFNAFTGTNDPNDDFGHGTMLAGVMGAMGDNGKGVTGVAWIAQIMSCKCLNNAGNGSDSTVIECMDYARTNGARVLNASFSAPFPAAAVSNAIVALRDEGIILVASCGNGFPRPNVDEVPVYPACYPMDNIISVLYTTRNDQLGFVSGYGPTNVDLGAPGDQITSTAFGADNSYVFATASGFSGTSFAAPMVAGACALVMSRYPDENYQQIIARVLKATDPIPALAGKCVTGGRLNLWKALSPPINLVSVPGVDGAPFQLHISTGANRVVAIESSPDLATWTPIFTNTTAADGTFDFTDTNSPDAAQRFYRAVSEP